MDLEHATIFHPYIFVFGSCERLLHVLNLVSTVFGTVSSLHPTDFYTYIPTDQANIMLACMVVPKLDINLREILHT